LLEGVGDFDAIAGSVKIGIDEGSGVEGITVIFDPDEILFGAGVDTVENMDVVGFVPIVVGAIVILGDIDGEGQVSEAGDIDGPCQADGEGSAFGVDILSGKEASGDIGQLDGGADIGAIGTEEVVGSGVRKFGDGSRVSAGRFKIEDADFDLCGKRQGSESKRNDGESSLLQAVRVG